MIKKIFLNLIKVVLISSPVTVLCISFVKTFWGPIYKLDVNSSNITAIEKILHKDNIEIDNINNLTKIELCGQGLWDYESLDFYYNDGKIKSINLYTSEKSYYIDEYLYSNTFNYDDMFKIPIFISLTTIVVTICVKIKRKKFIKNKNGTNNLIKK